MHWRVSGVTALSGLWISSALFAYLAVKLVAAIAWLLRAPRLLRGYGSGPRKQTRPERNMLPAASAAAPFNLARRRFVQTVSAVAGAHPIRRRRLRLRVRAPALPDAPRGLAGERPAAGSRRHAHRAVERHPHRQLHVRARSSPRRGHGQRSRARTSPSSPAISSPAPGDPLEACIDELSRLRAPLGVWGCNGNHEVYADVEALAAKLFAAARNGPAAAGKRRAGAARPAVQLDWRGLPARAPHPAAAGRCLAPSRRLVRRDVPNILLSHNPNSFPRAAELGIQVQAGRAHPRRPGARRNSRPSLQPRGVLHALYRGFVPAAARRLGGAQ